MNSNIWAFISQKLTAQQRVLLLYVVASKGSSPGRQGFHLAVATDDEMMGTIGGGIMEHKLVEKARSMLSNHISEFTLMAQYHDKTHPKNQSGMICAGEQWIAFIPLTPQDLPQINLLLSDKPHLLTLSPAGLTVSPNMPPTSHSFHFESTKDWQYTEVVGKKPTVHIFGGGHVGLALSEVMAFLDFTVHIYDNRPDLNTMEQNTFAHHQHIIPYEDARPHLDIQPQDYVVLMTFGYRSDKLLFEQLMDLPCAYMGMMGSEAKLKQLRAELLAEGMAPAAWARLHAPIGLPIFSKTAKEIAVSVAAEIVRVKNGG